MRDVLEKYDVNAIVQADATQGITMELLTIEEFAERMKISRSTVFDWIRKGRFKAGRHYMKIGRVIRFEWGPELILKLREDSAKEHEKLQSNPLSSQARFRKERRPNKGRVAINLDC
ncbi:MAG: helix-turn-helix domain-containing protein [Nitrospirota bacterium]